MRLGVAGKASVYAALAAAPLLAWLVPPAAIAAPWAVLAAAVVGRAPAAGAVVTAAGVAVLVDGAPAVAALAVAAAGLVVVTALLAQPSGRDGVDVLIEGALGAGVASFVATMLGLDVLAGEAPAALLATALACSTLAFFASASCAAVSGARPRWLVLVGASGLLVVASSASTAGVGSTLDDRAVDALLVGAAALVGAHVVAPRLDVAPGVVHRPAPVSFGRLAVVVVAVAAGPFMLAAIAADVVDAPSSPIGAAPLVVLAGLGVVHLARQLDRRTHLEHLALHDELTGLPNRVLFVERLEAALGDGVLASASTTLLFVDVDRFKRVNDSLGHGAGDDLLKTVASRLREELRESDLVARLGGDEFAVLLPGCDERLGQTVAERMLSAVSSPVSVAGHDVFVGASIGMAIAPQHGTDATTLLKNADAAMYSAKDAGRNRWGLYREELNSTAEEKLDLEADLHRALDAEGELVVHYQPKVDVDSGAIVGAEALVRWEHPTRGLLGPAQFVPLAEDTGLIDALGEWVLTRTCTDLKAWTDRGLPPIVVSVNLSARQFEHHPIADVVARVLRSTGLPPALLELELTESLALQDSGRVLAMLQDLRSLGVSCSIDDFGTGYSGLNYLTRFPIDRLKIDRSFIAEIGAGGRDAGLVAAVIAMAHGLGLGVVAEGVETDEQAAFLRAHGCEQMQGYLVSRPVPAAAFEGLLAERGAGAEPDVALASVHVLRPGFAAG